jgi:hypothetical protein
MSTRSNGKKRDFLVRITAKVARARRRLNESFDEFSRCSERYGPADLRTVVAQEAVIESVRELMRTMCTEVEVRRDRGLIGKEIRKVSSEERRRLQRYITSNVKWGTYTSMASLLDKAGVGPRALPQGVTATR